VGSPSTAWIYGSVARGDSDASSDLDVLSVAGDSRSLTDINTQIHAWNREASITSYSWMELEGMAGYGSLFLHHLRLEGRPLFSERDGDTRLSHLLRSVGPYSLAKRDLRAFQVVIGDVEKACRSERCIPYEASVTGTVIRHASILGCYLRNRPQFGRISPVLDYLGSLIGPDRWPCSFEELYDFRLAADGRELRLQSLSTPELLKWCGIATCLLKCLEGDVHEYERNIQGPTCAPSRSSI